MGQATPKKEHIYQLWDPSRKGDRSGVVLRGYPGLSNIFPNFSYHRACSTVLVIPKTIFRSTYVMRIVLDNFSEIN